MSALKLVIFDVDGTLVDSQADIMHAMAHAFQHIGLPIPPRQAVLSVVGLSLPQAMARLAPDVSASDTAELVQAYKEAFATNRRKSDTKAAPMYPGMPQVIETLKSVDYVLLGIATGKSRRGLTALLKAHRLGGVFITKQVADDHPSKPHPSMILTALSETGVAPHNAVMVGDTSYDIDMAKAAGIASIGVGWGYHPDAALGQATRVVHDGETLLQTLEILLGDFG